MLQVELIPQTHYGFRNTSQKGPYKLKVSFVGESCSNIDILSTEIFDDSQGINFIAWNYDKKSLLKLAGTKLYSYVYSDEIDININDQTEIFIILKVNFDLSKNSTLIFKLIPKKVEGKTKIPLFTT